MQQRGAGVDTGAVSAAGNGRRRAARHLKIKLEEDEDKWEEEEEEGADAAPRRRLQLALSSSPGGGNDEQEGGSTPSLRGGGSTSFPPTPFSPGQAWDVDAMEGLGRTMGIAGHLAKIKLENFMSHAHFELKFG